MRVIGYALVMLAGVASLAAGLANRRDPRDFPGAELLGAGVVIYACSLLWYEARQAGLFERPGKVPPPADEGPPRPGPSPTGVRPSE